MICCSTIWCVLAKRPQTPEVEDEIEESVEEDEDEDEEEEEDDEEGKTFCVTCEDAHVDIVSRFGAIG
ncbi:hypothetical protein CEXT_326651 [Caerostris extrusa]|uniref:Uncharacterized protein n=1 Tax=Caerostris extrusa TaxID=172846 RepID=A0AAV4ST60_CAEEX|nr:hypothetical protein CEXT_326651 [Caerostris extrusa]